MHKDEIRKRILSLRTSHSPFNALTKSYRIKEKLFRLSEFIKAKTILFYVATKDEVKTERMIKHALKLGKRIAVPISNVRRRSILISELKDFDEELEPGTFGILEPKKEFRRLIEPKEVDLVIVPGIAFDEEGNRIGYGMGFYDRFLKTIRKDTPIIALAYEFQIVEGIPADETDVTVNKIITEERIIECKKV